MPVMSFPNRGDQLSKQLLQKEVGYFLQAAFYYIMNRFKGLWDDPPGYFDLAVWPRYLELRQELEESSKLKYMHIFNPANNKEMDDLDKLLDSLF
jgi:hypothetical protein